MSNRPVRRTLVRWNDDHDKELLLWLNYCSNEAGIKLPFARVAQCMGASFSEGACIQHLAKIRNKMEDAGLHVPPAQKRGTVTRKGSSIYRPKLMKLTKVPVPRVRAEAPPELGDDEVFDDEEEEDEDEPSPVGPAKGPSTRKKTRRHSSSLFVKEETDDDEPTPALYDSDNEYGAKKLRQLPGDMVGSTPRQVQTTLNFNNSSTEQQVNFRQATPYIDPEDFDPGTLPSAKRTPVIKYETAEDRMAVFNARPSVTKQGTRRKISAISVDGDVNDIEGEGQGKANRKKSKKAHPTQKKQSREDKGVMKTYGPADKFVRPEHATSSFGMPFPSIPATTADNARITRTLWSTGFLNDPFAVPNFLGSNTGSTNIGDGTWNDQSAIGGGTGNLGWTAPGSNFDNQAVDDPTFDPYHGPGLQYISGQMLREMSPSYTRNSSFASAASNSTVETVPKAWNQPIHYPGYANPHEASMALNLLRNNPVMNKSDAAKTPVSPITNHAQDITWKPGMPDIQDGQFPQRNPFKPNAQDPFMGAPALDDNDEDWMQFINLDMLEDN